MFGLGDEFEIDENFLDEVFQVEKASISNASKKRRDGSNHSFERSHPNILKVRQHSSILSSHGESSDADSNFQNSVQNSFIAEPAIAISHQHHTDLRLNEYSSRKVRPRKFPGPAGLLPERQGNSSLIATEDFLNELEEELKEESKYKENEVLSQDSAKSLENPAWIELIRDLGPDGRNLLKNINVASVCTRAKQTKTLKVPFLALLIQNVDASTADPCLYLSDVTGEIVGAVHRDVWEHLGQDLVAGTVIVLINVGVLCAGNTTSKLYLNITNNNIAALYSPTNCNDIRVTSMKPLAQPDCAKFLQTWKELLLVPVQHVSQPTPDSSRQLFSTASLSPLTSQMNRRPNLSNKVSVNSVNRSFEISFNDQSPSLTSSLKYNACPANRTKLNPVMVNNQNQSPSLSSQHSHLKSNRFVVPTNNSCSHFRGSLPKTPVTPFAANKRPRFDSSKNDVHSQDTAASQSIVESLLDGIDTDSLFGDF